MEDDDDEDLPAEDSEAPILEHIPLMEDVPVMNPTRYDDEESFENEHSYIEINQPHIAHQQIDNFAAESVSKMSLWHSVAFNRILLSGLHSYYKGS